MTNHQNDTQGDCTAIAGIALRCMRVYMDLLHRGLFEHYMLSTLSTTEVAILREMMLATYDDYDVMNVGNAILFVDDELRRRGPVAETGTLSVTTRYPKAQC